MRKFLSSVMAVTVLLGGSPAYAASAKIVKSTDTVDGSTIEITFAKDGGVFTRSKRVTVTRICTKEKVCSAPYVADQNDSGPGVLETLAAPAGFVAGMRGLRPSRGDSTYVSNDSSSKSQAEGGSARADAYVDQSYRTDDSTRFDFWGNDGPVGIFLPPPPPPPPPAPDMKG